MKTIQIDTDHPLYWDGDSLLICNSETGLIRGTVITSYGLVSVATYPPIIKEKGRGYTILYIVKNGRLSHRSFNKQFKARGLITKAKRFAKEVYHDG